MPYTEEFKKIRRHYSNLYSDKAKAETFAFEKAFKRKVPTFESRKPKYKKNKAYRIEGIEVDDYGEFI